MKELFLSFVALAVAPPGLAYANPRALPFTYTTDTLAPGAAEIEQTVDAVPLRATSINTGAETSYLATSFQTELEIGLCRNLELALYFTFAPAQQSLTVARIEWHQAAPRRSGRVADRRRLLRRAL